jgi:inhibitor of cysteine peptidase
MKKLIILCLVSILLVPLLMVGCSGGPKTIEISLDEFVAQNNIVKNIDLSLSDILTVKLGSNPTTGYSWNENATMLTAQKIITQQSYDYVEPTSTGIVGAGGTSVWTFKAVAAGVGIIQLSYSRPWEGGEKDTYTLTINVTVK